MALLLVYLILALGISTLCSLLEAGLLSLPRSHVSLMAGQGKRSGIILQNMQKNIDEPLSAILTFNTIAHTVGAAGVGAQAQLLWGEQWLTAVSAILTLLILVFSEILPKTVGARFAKSLAKFTAYATRTLTYMTWPIVQILRVISGLIGGEGHGHDTSRDELLIMAKLGRAQGILKEKEFMMIENLFQLDHIQIKEVMTPRTVVQTLPDCVTVQQAAEELGPLRFGRIPVIEKSSGGVVGVVLRYKILEALGAGQNNLLINSLMQPLHQVVEQTVVSKALNQFVERKEHLFLVIDEFGNMTGIVTLEDALETLLGFEIVDETDEVSDMREYAKRLAKKRKQKRIQEGSGPSI